MKKRILIFSTAYLPLVGGAEVAVKEITDRLFDFEFVMVTARLDPQLPVVEKVGNIEVHRMGKGNHWDKYRLAILGPKFALNLGHFDAIWGIMASYAGFAALGLKKRLMKTPFLLTLQEGDSRWDIYKHVWWCWSWFKQIFKKADKIQAISNYLAQWAKNLGAQCEIEVVPNGVDVDKFKNQKSKFKIKEEITNKLDLANGAKLVVTVSRLVKKNGIGDLIKAMKFLEDDVHLLVIGTGQLESKLKELTKKLFLTQRAHFLGNINHQDLPQYLQGSDVFCRPSLSEGLGNVFLEAMIAGIPIVGTDVGGIHDFLKDKATRLYFLEDNQTGLPCKVNDSEDIAKQIKRILDDPALAEKLRVNGRKLVEEKYSWNLVAQKMNNIFNLL